MTMAANASTRVAIVGAGLGGALMACYLAQDGYAVDVYERRPDPRVHGFVGGRSINLALSARGIAALAEAGLAEAVLKTVIPMPGRMIHLAEGKGEPRFQSYSKDASDRINSVSRAGLNLLLLDAAAKHPNVRLHFDHRCAGIEFSSSTNKPSITFERGPQQPTVTASPDLIIGADGAFSAVRLQMMLHMDRMAYEQSFLDHGYKELTIPPAEQCGVDPKKWGGFAMNPNALHIWPRGGYMMIALPNQDKSFTCTLFWPFKGPNGFEALRNPTEILTYFKAHFPDAVPLMPTLVEDYQRNPTSSLVMIHCRPWQYKDKAVLIGDAAHAIVPFYGQGMNCAFEDCSVLRACMKKWAPDWGTVFEKFSESRKPNTDAIGEMALHNFIEMRDHTASRLFRLKKHVEHGLHRFFPRWFMPLYNMISFSTIPYAEAQARARAQSTVLKAVAVCGLGLVALGVALIVSRAAL
jgi:kynurenine 3-monooxygenase